MGLDSVDILTRVEKTFDIKITDEEAQQILTVGDYYDAVWRNLAEKDDGFKKEMESIVNRIIGDAAGIDLDKITADKKLADDLGID